MSKLTIKTKIISLVALATVASSILYYQTSFADNEVITPENASILLNVEKLDRDTVKIELNDFVPVAKSLQLHVEIDGNAKFIEDSVNWLATSDDEEFKNHIQVSADGKSMDILVVSTEALDKTGGKLELFEIDVEKVQDGLSAYTINPVVNENGFSYSYVENKTNAQVSGIDIANGYENKLTINSEPVINLKDLPEVIEDKIVITKDSEFDPLTYIEVTDEEDGIIPNESVTVEGTVKTDIVGSYVINYKVTDSEGDLGELTQSVVVEETLEETEAPTFNVINPSIVVTLGEEVDLLEGVIATDYLGRDLVVTVEGVYDLNTVGEYALKYRAEDRFGNVTEIEFTLIVNANNPTMTVTNKTITTVVTKEVDLLANVTATDYEGNPLTVTVEGDYDFNTAGTYTLKYRAEDRFGNVIEEEFTLTVTKAEEPTINVTNTVIEIVAGENVDLLEGITATDYEGNPLTVTVVGDYDVNVAGEYKLQYRVEDNFGNVVFVDFVLNVSEEVVNPEEPTNPEEPGITPEEEGTNPEEPGTTPEEEGTNPEEPGTTPEEEGTNPEEPGITPEEEGTNPEEPGITPEEEGTNPEEPGTTPEEEGSNPEEPGITPEADGANPEEPGITPEEEGTNPEEPLITPDGEQGNINPDESVDVEDSNNDDKVTLPQTGQGINYIIVISISLIVILLGIYLFKGNKKEK